MPLLKICQSPVMGIWKIEETWRDLLDLFQNKSLFTGDVLDIQSEKRKCEWLATRLLIKYLTGTERPVCYKENGSPFLHDSYYQISISHTKGYAAVILSRFDCPGIDIEYPSDRAWKVRARFMSAEELLLFDSFPDNCLADNEKKPSQSTLATLCWCLKETAFKALQESAVDFIKHLLIEPFTLSERGVVTLTEKKTSQQEAFAIHYQIADDYIITWKA